MRISRGFVLAAAVLTSALVVTGCARDTGTPQQGGGGSGGTECTRNPAPAAAGGGAATPAPIVPNADASGLRLRSAWPAAAGAFRQ